MVNIKSILAGVGLVATTAICIQAVQQESADPEIMKEEKLVNDFNVYANN